MIENAAKISTALSQHLSQMPPEGPNPTARRIYHYTRTNGLEGIVKTKELWATNIHYLNDYEEIRSGFEALKQATTGLEQSSPDLVRRFLTRLKGAADQYQNISVYVCSFTEESDLLSQWRGYASPEAFRSVFGMTS